MAPARDDMDDLPAALDLAVFERTPGGLFRAIGALPDWAKSGAENPAEIDLADRFPLLELFLADCAPVFETGTPALLDSDVWEESTESGRHFLQATALRLGARNLAVLRRLPPERFTYQQLYHDYQLAEEKMSRLREVAERATKAKSDFLAMISHEIRAPLSSIIGMVEVLAASPLNLEQQQHVQIVQRTGENVLKLINDLLDLSKVEVGRIDLESVPIDLHEILSRARELVGPRFEAKGVALRQSIAPGVPVLLTGDPSRLRQVILNLLGNALKFTAQGSVEIRVEKDPEGTSPGCLRFAVADTGIGIPEDKLNLIFESYTQADQSTAREYGGTGLGLTISRRIVELMGGRIWAESRPGRGSTFFFTLELGVQADQPLPPAEHRWNGLRILVVDDDEANRLLIEMCLRRKECTIETATNGREAVDRFRCGRYDVVLMDVVMPEMDGDGATREIRRYEREAGLMPTPVVALTAHDVAQFAGRSQDVGYTAYLQKPIRPSTLVETLDSYSKRTD